MLETVAARLTPAAIRNASIGRPESAVPSARVPSNDSRRSGSRRSSISASRTTSSPSSQRSDIANGRTIMFHANRPSGSRDHSSPNSAIAPRASMALASQCPVTVATLERSIIVLACAVRSSCSCLHVHVT